jgi:8-oxo-dGTP pyrophosphatase MutT (NUDIX family)
MSNLKREFSAGCVVFKKEKENLFFLLGKHSGYHKWVLAKGLIEKGEKGPQTAKRETKEELGVSVKLKNKKPIHKEQYFFYATYKDKKENKKEKKKTKAKKQKKATPEKRVKKYQEQGGKKTKVFKTVSFYLAEYKKGDPKLHSWEMEKTGWFEFKKAFKKLAFKGEKKALKKARQILKNKNKKKIKTKTN